MPRLIFSFVFTLLLAVIVAFPQPNSDDSPVPVVDPVETPENSASPPAEGESVDLRYRPSYASIGYGGQQYGSNYYSSEKYEKYESHYGSQQVGHQNYGHQNYGHQNYGHQNYGHQNYGHNAYGHNGYGYERPYGYGYGGYHGGYSYYGRPQGILGTVGNVLDGLLGLREGEKKPAVDGEASSAPVISAAEQVVDPSAVVSVADSAPQTSFVNVKLTEPVPESEGAVSSPGGGEEVIFQ